MGAERVRKGERRAACMDRPAPLAATVRESWEGTRAGVGNPMDHVRQPATAFIPQATWSHHPSHSVRTTSHRPESWVRFCGIFTGPCIARNSRRSRGSCPDLRPDHGALSRGHLRHRACDMCGLGGPESPLANGALKARVSTARLRPTWSHALVRNSLCGWPDPSHWRNFFS